VTSGGSGTLTIPSRIKKKSNFTKDTKHPCEEWYSLTEKENLHYSADCQCSPTRNPCWSQDQKTFLPVETSREQPSPCSHPEEGNLEALHRVYGILLCCVVLCYIVASQYACCCVYCGIVLVVAQCAVVFIVALPSVHAVVIIAVG
jgi:hypothetical protein